jgi:hypothetical protein
MREINRAQRGAGRWALLRFGTIKYLISRHELPRNSLIRSAPAIRPGAAPAPSQADLAGLNHIVGELKLAEADLDVVIRAIAKQPNKSLMEAAKKRHDRFMAMAASAKDKEAKGRFKQIAKDTMLHAGAAARRLHLTAQNAADAYARAMKKAAEQPAAKKAAEPKPVKKAVAPKPAKKAVAKKPVRTKKA